MFSAARQSAFALALLCAALLTDVGAAAQVKGALSEQLARAASLIGENQLAEAERLLSSVLKVAPEEAAALNLLGTIRAKQGRLEEAESLFARALRADNKLTGARMNLAYLYLLKGAPEKSAAELKRILLLEPGNAEATYRLAWLLLSTNRVEECISFVEGERASRRPLSVPLLNVLGEAYLKKGDAAKAEETYRLALDARGDDAEALLGMARVSHLKGDAHAAALHLGRAKEAITDSPALLYKFALAALTSNLNDDALTAVKRAVALRPDDATYHFLLGVAWLRHSRPDLQEAEQAFRQSLKLRPDDAQGQLHLGYALLKQKKYPEAREWLERSVARGAGTPESFYYLGLIAQEQGEDERAVELFEKSIALAPAFASAHVALGATLLKLKNYPRAQQALEAGVRLNPADSKAHYQLAVLYTRLKQPERAQEEMRLVEKLKSEGKTQEASDDALAPPPPH